MDFLILPTHLFEKKYLNKKYNYILWEHPQYFTKYNFNKKKLLLHRYSMKYYESYLKRNGLKVKYYTFNEVPDETDMTMFDPIDKINIKNIKTILDNPGFILSREDCDKYRQKTKKFFFNAFYMWSKKEKDILPGIKSKDKQNRKVLKEDVKITFKRNKYDSQLMKESKDYIEKHFNDNYGNLDNFIFPTTHKMAKQWLKYFIDKKFEKFGPFQDYISKDNNYLYHSLLSTSINIGLLTPNDILKEIEKKKSNIPINSYEGFIRQLFWREYQQYCYRYFKFDGNYFGNKKKLTKDWYNGSLGIKPVDDCITEAFETGYLHHIKRLMVIGNFMNLSGISPKEGYRWFMEFSCDSYEWVMHQNVYEMVFFISGGGTMRRPYISSSNYILKMSNYKKDDWAEKWDKLYDNFLKVKKNKLWKFRYHFRGLK